MMRRVDKETKGKSGFDLKATRQESYTGYGKVR